MVLALGIIPFEKDMVLVNKISEKLDIPSIMKDTKIGFIYRFPTKEELATCEHVVISSPEP